MKESVLKKILPPALHACLQAEEKIFEIRLRLNCPIFAETAQGRYFCSPVGLTLNRGQAVRASREVLDGIFLRACDHSVHAYEHQIREGFLSVGEGIRLGLCGECVTERGRVTALKNLNALLIRLPHEVRGCASFLTETFRSGVTKLLILSPPGGGKTTLLRDVARLLSGEGKNVLLLDERGELCLPGTQDLDVLKNCSKREGFLMGIRAMAPDFVLCDELRGEEDLPFLKEAEAAGVGVVATVHAGGLSDLKKKGFPAGYFERFAVLSSARGRGTVEGLFDAGSRLVYALQ